jgi:hypothetical protein
MRYSVSKEADKAIEEDISVITEIILERINPLAIIMFGGFGHEAGSFRKIGKKIVPLNDYDMYIISKDKIEEEKIKELEIECSKAIGRGGKEIVRDFGEKYDINQFFHVDLHFIEAQKLKQLYPTQRTYDLRTSLVVFGDKGILENIPSIKIPKSDAIRLLFNKLNHFAIAEGNSEIIKSIYAVKGFTDLCSALLIFEGRYVSNYQEREKIFQSLNVPDELKELVSKATKSKLYKGYSVENVEEFFKKSKKWVEYTLKRILKEYLRIKSDNWKEICNVAYKKLPYIYFNDYLKNKYLFFGQYYLNIKFFIEGIRNNENLIRALIRWRDAGLIIAISLILYSFNEEKESEKYLGKLTAKIFPLRERMLKLYSLYYLQKLI